MEFYFIDWKIIVAYPVLLQNYDIDWDFEDVSDVPIHQFLAKHWLAPA